MKALSVKNLKKIYQNNKMALNGINLDVKDGDFFALLGQNGAGKSTTIGIISSLINKTEGSVEVFGYDIDKHRAQAKSLIGIVPQEINFNSFEKIFRILIHQAGYYGIPKQEAEPRAERYLKAMGLWDMRDQQAIRLSGGMKRRLMIARGLMNEPRLLILDEPTAGVDIELRHHLWKFLTELNKAGTTIILTTHYLEEAENLCKNVAIIDHGEIIENSDMKSLINRLHIQTMVLDIETELPTFPELEGYTWRMQDDSTLEIEINRQQSLNDLFNRLSAQNIRVTSMRNKTNRLEELFLRLITDNNQVQPS